MFARVSLAFVAVLGLGCKDKSKTEKQITLHPQTPSSLVAVPDASAARSLDEELEAMRAEHELPALAAAVWRDGKLLEHAAVGLRKADDPASKVTTADLWHLASNTKAMTATLIAIYVDRGTIAWNDTLASLFKGTKIDPGYAKVTLDQLIRHEGGVDGGIVSPELWKQLWEDGDKPDARAKFVAATLARPPAQPPGTFVYSNAGYMIAAAALERRAKKPWEQLMRDELFGKLGMTSCGFGAPGTPPPSSTDSGVVVDQPWGHDAGGAPIAPGPAADNPPGLGPAGTVHCSLEDYGKFLALHATGKPDLVSPEAMQHLHTARDQGYAGGWRVVSSPRGSRIGHSGSNTMWYATAMVALTPEPEDRYAFVMATNSGSDAIERVFGRLVKRHAGATTK
jgi:D-alanyl-D-alanine carboxypeptidase